MIAFPCPGCGKGLKVKDELAGKKGKCPHCQQPVTVPADLPLGLFMDQVAPFHRHTTYPVLDSGRAVGLLTLRCVAETPRSEWETKTARDCMLPRERVPVLAADESAVDALAELGESESSRALVLEGSSLAGLLSISDLARALEVGLPDHRRGG